MEFKKLFHTVRDNNDVDYIENNAPFKSTKDTWLGEGYYFWENFIELAHWWGRVHCGGNYIICSTSCVVKDDIILDLYGNFEQLKDFKEYKDVLQNEYEKPLNVNFILNHMSKHLKGFKYKVIRAKSENCATGDQYLLSKRIKFIDKYNAVLNTNPEIQVCIWDKKILTGCNLKVIYPNELREDFII